MPNGMVFCVWMVVLSVGACDEVDEGDTSTDVDSDTDTDTDVDTDTDGDTDSDSDSSGDTDSAGDTDSDSSDSDSCADSVVCPALETLMDCTAHACCRAISGRPVDLENDCLGEPVFLECREAPVECGDMEVSTTDPEGACWWFNNTCFPTADGWNAGGSDIGNECAGAIGFDSICD